MPLKTLEGVDPPEALPPPSAALVLWRVSVQAHIATMSPRKADKYLRHMAELLANEENLSSLFQIRPASETLLVRDARRGAAALFKRYLPLLLSSRR